MAIREIRKTLTVSQEEFKAILTEKFGVDLTEFAVQNIHGVYPESMGLVQIDLVDRKFNEEVREAEKAQYNSMNACVASPTPIA